MNKQDYRLAHAYSSNNKPELEKDKICGCFYCKQIFSPLEIDDWIVEDTKIDYRGTALCPLNSNTYQVNPVIIGFLNHKFIFGGVFGGVLAFF